MNDKVRYPVVTDLVAQLRDEARRLSDYNFGVKVAGLLEDAAFALDGVRTCEACATAGILPSIAIACYLHSTVSIKELTKDIAAWRSWAIAVLNVGPLDTYDDARLRLLLLAVRDDLKREVGDAHFARAAAKAQLSDLIDATPTRADVHNLESRVEKVRIELNELRSRLYTAMVQCGIETGHGDTIGDLIEAMEQHAAEREGR